MLLAFEIKFDKLTKCHKHIEYTITYSCQTLIAFKLIIQYHNFKKRNHF